MNTLNESYCEAKYQMVTQGIVQVYLFANILSSFISTLFSLLVAYKFYRRHFFGQSFKILLFLLIFFTLIFNVAIFTGTSLTQYLNYSHRLPCDNLVYCRNCYWLLFASCLGIVGLVLTQFALSVERYLSSQDINGNCKDSGVKGAVLSAVVLILSISAVFLLLYNADPMELSWHCAGIPSSVIKAANILFAAMVGIDVLSVVIFIFVWRINLSNRKNGSYSVSKTLCINANLLVMRLFLPVVLVHFVMFSIYIIGMLIMRLNRSQIDPTTYSTVSTILYIVPFCTLVQLLMFLSILKKEDDQKIRNLNARLEKSKNADGHRELYEIGLAIQWNQAAAVG